MTTPVAPVNFDGTNTVENELLPLNQAWSLALGNAHPTLFPALAVAQHPKILWLGCSDSRAPETLLLGLLPGEVFVHRNIANLLHPADVSFPAVLRYALVEMQPPVQHIIVCGHVGCGGCKAVIGGQPTEVAAIDNWLAPLIAISKSHSSLLTGMATAAAKATALAQLNVQRSLGLLKVDPMVSQMVTANSLQVHGAIYDVGSGLLRFLEGPDQVEPPLDPAVPPQATLRTGTWRSQWVNGGLQTLVEGDVTFSQPYSTPPLIMIGLFGFDHQCQTRSSFFGTVSNVTKTGFHMKAQSGGDTSFWESSWNWVEVPQDGSYGDIQTGTWTTTSVRGATTPQTQTSQQINFPAPYTAAPTVIAWLNGWDGPGGSTPLLVSTIVTNITPTGFTINLDGSAALYSGSVCWLSAPSTSASGLSIGTVQTVTAGQGLAGNIVVKAASNPYNAVMSLSSFSFQSTGSLKAFSVIQEGSTATNVSWTAGTWGGSALVSATAGYVTIPPIP